MIIDLLSLIDDILNSNVAKLKPLGSIHIIFLDLRDWFTLFVLRLNTRYVQIKYKGLYSSAAT